uniref:Uncharacterized protein n=1 Tax=Anopheles dirus TaxID=7168 RepID=A0A182NY03_9DIPT
MHCNTAMERTTDSATSVTAATEMLLLAQNDTYFSRIVKRLLRRRHHRQPAVRRSQRYGRRKRTIAPLQATVRDLRRWQHC